MPESPSRILVVKLSAIGDVIHGLPVLNALKGHFSDAHITWVVEGRTGDLLRGHPALDRLIIAPRGWLKNPKAVWTLRQQLLQAQPHVALDLQGLARSAFMAWLSGAPRRIGFAGCDGREFSRWLHNDFVQPRKVHVIDRNLELLQPLGIENPAVRFGLPIFQPEHFKIQAYRRSFGMLGPFAVINPGAGWPSKRWEMNRFGRVAQYLGQVYQLPSLVVWAGQQEKIWAEEIVSESAGFARLAPPTTLRELAELVRSAKLFVGSDTGPLHLAAALGTKSVGLFGPVSAQRNGPYGKGHVSVQKVCLSGSSRLRRNADNEAMRAISVDDVMNACDQILQKELSLPRSA